MSVNKEQVNEVYNYWLFNDIDDEDLREKNRAKTMTIIYESNVGDNGNLSDEGVNILNRYFGFVDMDDRASLFVEFLNCMERNGHKVERVVESAKK